jgi:hypothetical protein
MRRVRPGLCSILPALLLVGACSRTVNTLPPVVSPTTPVLEHTLQLPPGLEIRSVDYQATMFSDVSGGVGTIPNTTTTGGRAFIKVYAVDTGTGDQVLLLYENVARRTEPIQIIRFRSQEQVEAMR